MACWVQKKKRLSCLLSTNSWKRIYRSLVRMLPIPSLVMAIIKSLMGFWQCITNKVYHLSAHSLTSKESTIHQECHSFVHPQRYLIALRLQGKALPTNRLSAMPSTLLLTSSAIVQSMTRLKFIHCQSSIRRSVMRVIRRVSQPLISEKTALHIASDTKRSEDNIYPTDRTPSIDS